MAQEAVIDSANLAERLALALNACNLSRGQFSAMLGVHKSMVSRWLSGEMKPSSYNLARISTAIAMLKPGFNMTLWTAPSVQFEAALTLSAETVGVSRFSSRAGAPIIDAAAGRAPPHDRPSLAVLPFVNLGRDSDQDYFVAGMMEEIITALGRIRSIFVLGSTLRFEDQSVNVSEAARLLGVGYILEGSVRRSGTRIRISVKLTDAIQGTQVWAERFEKTLDDVFALQDQVALSIAGVIEPAVLAVERRHASRHPIESLGCYDLCLQAAALRATLRKTEVFQAIELLNRALTLQPGSATALGQAASCHSLIVLNNWSENRELHRQQGLMMAERAISSGSDDAAVLAQTANALMELDRDMGRARALIDRATTLNPGLAYGWFVSGVLSLIEADGDAAARHFEEAARLDPLSSLGDMARVHIAMARLLQGDFIEAAHLYRETTYRTPRIHLMMAAAFGELNNLEEARRELALYVGCTPVPPKVMLDRSTSNAAFRARIMEGLKRAGARD